MKKIGVTQPRLRGAGGPSISWFTKLPTYSGRVPSQRQREHLDMLDTALQWPPGTSWGLLTGDRSDWPDYLLTDEEDSLVTHRERYSTFAFMVERHLSTLEPEDAEVFMRRIAREIGLPFGDMPPSPPASHSSTVG